MGMTWIHACRCACYILQPGFSFRLFQSTNRPAIELRRAQMQLGCRWWAHSPFFSFLFCVFLLCIIVRMQGCGRKRRTNKEPGWNSYRDHSSFVVVVCRFCCSSSSSSSANIVHSCSHLAYPSQFSRSLSLHFNGSCVAHRFLPPPHPLHVPRLNFSFFFSSRGLSLAFLCSRRQERTTTLTHPTQRLVLGLLPLCN